MLNFWLPWINFFSWNFFLQLSIIYVLYLIFFSKNIYYILFYFFLLIFYFGIFLCFYQLDLFTGFLWLAECVIIFCALILIFYLNTAGTWNKLLTQIRLYTYIGFFLILIFLSIGFYFSNTLETNEDVFFNNIFYWDDFYESLINSNVNDFTTFLISYYTVNSYLLLTIAFLILVGSLICVNLNKLIRINKIKNLNQLFHYYNFFKSNLSFSFIRQQNLVLQEKQIPATRIFKKKK